MDLQRMWKKWNKAVSTLYCQLAICNKLSVCEQTNMENGKQQSLEDINDQKKFKIEALQYWEKE